MKRELHNTSIGKLFVSKDGTFAAWGRNKREALYIASKKLGRMVNWNEMKRETNTMVFCLNNCLGKSACLLCN